MFLDIECKMRAKPVAVQDDGTAITYGEMTDFSEEMIHSIPSRSLVFCLCKNSIGSVAGYVAVMSANCVPLMLGADIDNELLNALVETYQPDYIWVPQDILGEKTYLFSRINRERRIVRYGYELVRMEKKEKCLKLHPELALLMTTSGSTGSPKLVRQSKENVVANASAIADYLEIEESDKAITTLPMSYTYGLSIINSHLLRGAELLLTDLSIVQREFWDFFNKGEATSLAGVPYIYEMLKKIKFDKMQLPSLRCMTQAGGRLGKELHKEFAELANKTGRRFYVMYGQTEATARMTYLPYANSLQKVGSIGIPIPGGAVILEGVDGQIIENPHEVGELVYKGRNVTLGYATALSDLSKGDENHGILHTGDMAEMDEDGYLYIVGRKKRFLKIFGNRVGLDESEELIEQEFKVECACTGTDDDMRIYFAGDVEESAVKIFISEKTGLNQKAFTVKGIEKIPRNENGKKAYNELG